MPNPRSQDGVRQHLVQHKRTHKTLNPAPWIVRFLCYVFLIIWQRSFYQIKLHSITNIIFEERREKKREKKNKSFGIFSMSISSLSLHFFYEIDYQITKIYALFINFS